MPDPTRIPPPLDSDRALDLDSLWFHYAKEPEVAALIRLLQEARADLARHEAALILALSAAHTEHHALELALERIRVLEDELTRVKVWANGASWEG